MTTTVIPCKRPRVLVDAVGSHGRWQADCYVPGCRWAYGNVVKSDVEDQATRHRGAHRAAVPTAYLTTPSQQGPEYDVYCPPCGGHRRTFATRRDAQAWIDEHLTREHGVVVCDG